jgi:hypothetical protein
MLAERGSAIPPPGHHEGERPGDEATRPPTTAQAPNRPHVQPLGMPIEV